MALVLTPLLAHPLSNNYSSDFSENSTHIVFIGDGSRYNKSSDGLKNENTCQIERKIFCANDSAFDTECLIKNKELLTGACRDSVNRSEKTSTKIKKDLSLPFGTKYFGLNKGKTEIRYKLKKEMVYRGVIFRKGWLTVRIFNDKNYNGQYVIIKGYPKKIFKDKSGIEYNPLWQAGPFFFDQRGNVSIGTLSKTIEYKIHVYIKRGSLIAFNEKRELIRGVLANSTEIGRCFFLKNMIINESIIKKCKSK